eukprot:scaffold118082_cov34-Tisochrysis_lutea.AAC.3
MTAVEAVHKKAVEHVTTLKMAALTPRAASAALALPCERRPMQRVSIIESSGSARHAPSTGIAKLKISTVADGAPAISSGGCACACSTCWPSSAKGVVRVARAHRASCGSMRDPVPCESHPPR